MAVPKRKTSPSRRNMRRSHHALTAGGPCRLPQLRRAQASPSCLRRLRPLCRPRSREGEELKRSSAGKVAVARDLTVSIDAMGGDAGPGIVVTALLQDHPAPSRRRISSCMATKRS